MRIAILGSREQGESEQQRWETQAEFAAACHAIGKELARKNQLVIVGSESSSTACFHVVNGIIEEVTGRPQTDRPLIEVLAPTDDSGSYRRLERRHLGLFT